jgi:hypothetical protein
LAKHGGGLANAAKRHAIARARAKHVSTTPGVNGLQLLWLVVETLFRERRHARRLADLAKRATSLMWGIEEDRLDAELTDDIEFGNIREPSTTTGKVIRMAAAGYGGVSRHGSRLKVVAKAQCWPLLSHELVKGTAELVCLHGLNTLDRQTYDRVTEAADRIEYETWQMQAGSELWRRLLALLPRDKTVPDVLMNVARLAPHSLETLVMAVVEKPAWARQLIAAL